MGSDNAVISKQRLLLDVGCGSNKRHGFIGMDRRDLPGIEIVHDVEDLPWPLEEDSCSVIQMSHLWEHLSPSKTIAIMDEMWRVLEPDGQLVMTLPYGYSYGYLQDPTHQNPANEATWEYFDPAFDLYKVYRPRPWRIAHRDVQMFANMLVVLHTRKDRPTIGYQPPMFRPSANLASMSPDWLASAGPELTAQAFHILEYDSRTLDNHPTWMGIAVDKNPYDLWRYQEIIFRIKPDLIIECGTANGGSALFFASLLDMLGKGKVISIDLDDGTIPFEVNPSRTNPGERPGHPRILYATGSSIEKAVAAKAAKQAFDVKEKGGAVMVSLDSDHTKGHVYLELNIYSPLVTPGSYLVVEDGNVNGHPVYLEYGEGPFEALAAWLPEHPEFEVDTELERKYPITHNPNGWLKKREEKK